MGFLAVRRILITVTEKNRKEPFSYVFFLFFSVMGSTAPSFNRKDMPSVTDKGGYVTNKYRLCCPLPT